VRCDVSPGASASREEGEARMDDLMFVGLTLIVFGLSWALAAFCERL
jgi:hypothetical protein